VLSDLQCRRRAKGGSAECDPGGDIDLVRDWQAREDRTSKSQTANQCYSLLIKFRGTPPAFICRGEGVPRQGPKARANDRPGGAGLDDAPTEADQLVMPVSRDPMQTSVAEFVPS
jgi:hypothetical protein